MQQILRETDEATRCDPDSTFYAAYEECLACQASQPGESQPPGGWRDDDDDDGDGRDGPGRPGGWWWDFDELLDNCPDGDLEDVTVTYTVGGVTATTVFQVNVPTGSSSSAATSAATTLVTTTTTPTTPTSVAESRMTSTSPSAEPTTASLGDTESTSASSKAWVAGPVVGVFAGVALIFLIGLWFIRRRRFRSKTSEIAELSQSGSVIHEMPGSEPPPSQPAVEKSVKWDNRLSKPSLGLTQVVSDDWFSKTG